MERTVGIKKAGFPRCRARKFDGALDSFAARTGEKRFAHFAPREAAQALRKISCQIRHMTLQHSRAAPRQFVLQICNDVRVIVPTIMHTVARKEVQNHPAIGSCQFHALAARVLRIHSQQFEQSDPLGIDVVGVILKKC